MRLYHLGLEFNNFKSQHRSGIFECISVERFISWGWRSGSSERGSEDLSNVTKLVSRFTNFSSSKDVIGNSFLFRFSGGETLSRRRVRRDRWELQGLGTLAMPHGLLGNLRLKRKTRKLENSARFFTDSGWFDRIDACCTSQISILWRFEELVHWVTVSFLWVEGKFLVSDYCVYVVRCCFNVSVMWDKQPAAFELSVCWSAVDGLALILKHSVFFTVSILTFSFVGDAFIYGHTCQSAMKRSTLTQMFLIYLNRFGTFRDSC
jgi:hypothetical protein